MKYKICWVVLCKNEIDILPFVKQYWERLQCDVVVYDNGSTDGSLEFLSKLPYATVKHFDSDGQNDPLQKQIKEQAFLQLKDQYDIIIISDMDEVFYFENAEKEFDKMMQGGFNTMLLPLFSLCEDFKPQPQEDKLLHQLCHKFYKQRMNHTGGLDSFTKFSIFNTKNIQFISMSVGQHFVNVIPTQNTMIGEDAFGLHIDKGFGLDYYLEKRRKMGANLSQTNIKCGMAIEYLKSVEDSTKEYKEHQAKCFDINI